MVRCSYEQKPFRRNIMETFGATVTPSPSNTTEAGRKILAAHPGSTGSLGTAISEAVERALHVPENRGRYQLGSVLNQVVLHQSVIGLESYEALRELGEYPDIVIGCAGGGSNLGASSPPSCVTSCAASAPTRASLRWSPRAAPRSRAAAMPTTSRTPDRPARCARCTRSVTASSRAPTTRAGCATTSMSPIVSKLKHDGYLEAVAVRQTEVFEAGERFAKLETILPAPESSHAILAAIREAERCRETGEAKTILFGLTGTGYFDMVAYDRYNRGEMEDHVPSDEELEAGFATIPCIPGIQ